MQRDMAKLRGERDEFNAFEKLLKRYKKEERAGGKREKENEKK